VIDDMPLRRAILEQFLSSWATGLGLTVVSCRLDDVMTLKRHSGCRLVVMSLGAASPAEPAVVDASRTLAAIDPRRPVVIIGDRPTVENVEQAFETGTAGYIPISLEAEVAVAALNFVLAGGSYVPPEVLIHEAHSKDTPPFRPQALPLLPEQPEQPFESAPQDPAGCGAAGETSRLGRAEERAVGAPEPGCGEGQAAGELTARQQQVLACLKKARSNKEIARELAMSEATVKVHVRQVMKKLGAMNRTHAAVLAVAPNRAAMSRTIWVASSQSGPIAFEKSAAVVQSDLAAGRDPHELPHQMEA
jgi:DNA-binding NarL/FixJ family response regulator